MFVRICVSEVRRALECYVTRYAGCGVEGVDRLFECARVRSIQTSARLAWRWMSMLKTRLVEKDAPVTDESLEHHSK